MAKNSIPRVAPVTEALLSAYLAAHYRVELAGIGWALVVGRPAPAALAQWAHAQVAPADRWSLLTAWNPQSVARAAAANEAADAALRADLAARGLPLLRAMASSPEGSHEDDGTGQWNEPGWLVAGLTDTDADALAHRYGQAGILHWRRSEPVRLRMYAQRPDEYEGHRFVDWVQPQPN